MININFQNTATMTCTSGILHIHCQFISVGLQTNTSGLSCKNKHFVKFMNGVKAPFEVSLGSSGFKH